MTKSEILMALAFLLVLNEEEDKIPWGNGEEWEKFHTEVYRPYDSELFFSVYKKENDFPYDTGTIQMARALKWVGL